MPPPYEAVVLSSQYVNLQSSHRKRYSRSKNVPVRLLVVYLFCRIEAFWTQKGLFFSAIETDYLCSNATLNNKTPSSFKIDNQTLFYLILSLKRSFTHFYFGTIPHHARVDKTRRGCYYAVTIIVTINTGAVSEAW